MTKAQEGVVNIRGKDYQTVAYRVQRFREVHADWSLTTSVVLRDDDCVVMEATIAAPDGRVVANGHAEEYRKSSQINRTSALENAETSAIGRALAAFGLGGTEFASANEVQNAIHQQRGAEQSGGQQGETAPPYAFPEGPAKGITELKSMTRQLWREVEGCGDDGELRALLDVKENKEIVAQLAGLEDPNHRQIWEGDGKDNPGLSGLITRKQTEFAQHIADLARA